MVDICMVVFGPIAPFSPCPRVVINSGSTPDSRRVPLGVDHHRAFHMVQAALQTATAIVSSH